MAAPTIPLKVGLAGLASAHRHTYKMTDQSVILVLAWTRSQTGGGCPQGARPQARQARRRAQRRGERRDAILAAALEEFAARGFAATRLDDVARRAGVAKGTIYLYFRDKESLFQELIRAPCSAPWSA